MASLNVGLPILLKHFGHNTQTALKHYIQIDKFSINDKFLMRKIIGDLYTNQVGEFIERRMNILENQLFKYNKRLKALEKKQ